LYDNRRMLHARTAFTASDRHLRGIYLDRNEVLPYLRQKIEDKKI